MGPLVATGRIYVPEEAIKPLEAELEQLCEDIGFPEGAVQVVAGARVWMQACVVLEDTDRGRATQAMTPEEDVVQLALERADNHVS
jgi:hypothetical protein